MTSKKKISGLSILIYSFAAFWLVPFLFMILATLKPQNSIIYNIKDWFTPPFTIENYIHVFSKAPIMHWMVNSFIVAIVTTVGVIIISSLGGFGMSIRTFPFAKVIYFLVLAGIMIPGEAMLVPLFTLCINLNLLNNLPSLILPFLAVPFSILLLSQAFKSIPGELFESAEIDGCNNFRLFFSIGLPLVKSSLATVAILIFLGSWNSFLWPFISITNEINMTIPVGLPYFKSSGMGDGFQLPMTASLISVIPTIIFFFIFQKFIVEGISSTGIK